MKSFRICIQNIRKWTSNSRIWMLFFAALLFVYTYTKGIRQVADVMDSPISIWIYPFLFTYRYIKIIFMALLIFIFCDAPFIDTNQPYVMLRTKRSVWSIGQILYIMIGSFLYELFLIVSTIIVNIGNLEFTMEWGKVLGAMGTTSVASKAGVIYTTVNINRQIITCFTPLQAMFFSMLVTWLSFVFIGLVIYVVNVVTRTKIAGAVTAAGLVIFTAVADVAAFDGNKAVTWFSPMSWNSLNNIDIGGVTQYPTIDFVLGFYIVSIVILSIIAVVVGKKQNVEVSIVQ